ncbi:hypothetical protein AALB53_05570 [Lachnospiraceae bacterium 47-T17]
MRKLDAEFEAKLLFTGQECAFTARVLFPHPVKRNYVSAMREKGNLLLATEGKIGYNCRGLYFTKGVN